MANLPEAFKSFGVPSARMQAAAKEANTKAAANIVSGFPVISIRGKVWRIRMRGEEINLNRKDGSGPIHRADFVVIDAAEAISKVWYDGGWDDSTSTPPDCFSTNGVSPDAASPKKQCETCAACPRNAWGSKTLPSGKAGKECQSYKRLAVVFSGDLRGESFGGPMLLRMPAASLGGWKQYVDQLTGFGYPFYGVVSGMTFNIDESFPKLEFEPVAPLNDEQFAIIEEMRAHEQVQRILSTAVEVVQEQTGETPAATPASTSAPQAAAPVPQQEPVAPQATATVQTAAPVVEEAAPAPIKPEPAEETTPAPANIQNALEDKLKELNIGI